MKSKRLPTLGRKVNRAIAARRYAGVAALFLAFCAAAFAQGPQEPPQFDRATWRGDGFPLQPNRDADAFRSIWTTLESATEKKPFAKAVTLQLLKQGGQYKGNLLAVEGRLLRAERKALDGDEFFYDVWVLLPDTKPDPIRLVDPDGVFSVEFPDPAPPLRGGAGGAAPPPPRPKVLRSIRTRFPLAPATRTSSIVMKRSGRRRSIIERRRMTRASTFSPRRLSSRKVLRSRLPKARNAARNRVQTVVSCASRRS